MGTEAEALAQGIDWILNPPPKRRTIAHCEAEAAWCEEAKVYCRHLADDCPCEEEQAAQNPPPECDLDLLLWPILNQKEEER